ncbi:MAG: hypothetical protein WBM86_32175 [Waterburya sp.]
MIVPRSPFKILAASSCLANSRHISITDINPIYEIGDRTAFY